MLLDSPWSNLQKIHLVFLLLNVVSQNLGLKRQFEGFLCPFDFAACSPHIKITAELGILQFYTLDFFWQL